MFNHIFVLLKVQSENTSSGALMTCFICCLEGDQAGCQDKFLPNVMI